VSCAEPRYKVARAFASLMVVVYPFGVLMLFYFMLWYVQPSPGRDTNASCRGVGPSFISFHPTLFKLHTYYSHRYNQDEIMYPKKAKKVADGESDNENSRVESGVLADDPMAKLVDRHRKARAIDMPRPETETWARRWARRWCHPVMQFITAEDLVFLCEAYRPELWWWECLETGRRIIMTAVISIIEPGTSSQAVVTVILSVRRRCAPMSAVGRHR